DAFAEGRGYAVRGPFVPLLRSPEVMLRAKAMGDYLRFKSTLGPRLNEMVILITAREWTQQYEWNAHHPIALKAGLRPEIAAAIAEGYRPAAMAEDEEIAYDVATEILRLKRVSDPTYRRAGAEFGEQGVIDLLGVVGYYNFLAIVMNATRTGLPEGAAEPPKRYPEGGEGGRSGTARRGRARNPVRNARDSGLAASRRPRMTRLIKVEEPSVISAVSQFESTMMTRNLGELLFADKAVAADVVRWLGHLGAERRMSDKTLDAYRRDVHQLLEFLAGHLGGPVTLAALSKLTPADVRAFMASRRAGGIAGRSLMRSLAGARSFARFLEREGRVKSKASAL